MRLQTWEFGSICIIDSPQFLDVARAAVPARPATKFHYTIRAEVLSSKKCKKFAQKFFPNFVQKVVDSRVGVW